MLSLLVLKRDWFFLVEADEVEVCFFARSFGSAIEIKKINQLESAQPKIIWDQIKNLFDWYGLTDGLVQGGFAV